MGPRVRYVAGLRQGIKDGTGKVPSGKWQELRVEVKGNNIRGYLNGKLVVEANDDTFKSGNIGLWTKADSVTCFDDVKVTARQFKVSTIDKGAHVTYVRPLCFSCRSGKRRLHFASLIII